MNRLIMNYKTPKQEAHTKAAAMGREAHVCRLSFSGHFVAIAEDKITDYPHNFEIVRTYNS